jgi:N-acetylglucosamine kinase-like BadF-type ATPase
MNALESKFHNLTEFMDKSLYQDAAPTMEEAIQQYKIVGNKIINSILLDIDELLSMQIPEEDLRNYISGHSDYLKDGSAHTTLTLIKSVLSE